MANRVRCSSVGKGKFRANETEKISRSLKRLMSNSLFDISKKYLAQLHLNYINSYNDEKKKGIMNKIHEIYKEEMMHIERRLKMRNKDEIIHSKVAKSNIRREHKVKFFVTENSTRKKSVVNMESKELSKRKSIAKFTENMKNYKPVTYLYV